MTSDYRALADPQLLDILDGPPLALSLENLSAVREAWSRPPPLFEGIEAATETVTILVPGPSDAPDVPVLIHRPAARSGSLPCVLHMHGGGYLAGSPLADARQHRDLAASLGCCIVSVGYRLAPETPFPGAVEDCYAALAWLAQNAAALEIDSSRLGVMGESAGGGLAAALALLARDRGGPGLAFQHLIYPMLDERTGRSAGPVSDVDTPPWTSHSNQFGWTALLGAAAGSSCVSPYAAAARAEDLSRLPPTYIAVGALDLLALEDLDYARRLIRAGVAVELQVYPGAVHAFDFHGSAAVSIRARADRRAALARALRLSLGLSISRTPGD